MKKGQVYSCKIDKNVFPGTGVCTLEGEEIAIQGAYLDEEVSFRLLGRKKGQRVGQLLERIEAPCNQFDRCGGCISQHLSLDRQREIKLMEVKDLFSKQGIDLEDLEIFGDNQTFFYRNKVEFNFGDSYLGGPLELGFFQRNMGKNVLPTTECLLVHEDIRRIRDYIHSFSLERGYQHYHVMKREGFLRNLVLRRGHYTGEIMVNLVTTTQQELDTSFVAGLLNLKLEGEIVSVLHTENDSLSNFVYADRINLLYGRDYIEEKLLGRTFRISPFSFFQTNTRGAEVLFERLKKMVGKKEGSLYDLYCGTGTIGLLLSDQAKGILGVEIVEEAVEAARENALRNGVHNAHYYAMDVKDLDLEGKERPEILVVDPPRSGLHPKLIRSIIDLNVKEIFYVSCNPKSLLRDLLTFQEEGYSLEKMELVDLYPNTPHVETVIKMKHCGVAR